MIKIFVDGQEGTTGLKIFDYLRAHDDIQILQIDAARRKEIAARRELINASDITFLCLPDAASREAVLLVDNPHTCVIDTSTAFRVSDDWAYGLPELTKGQRDRIRRATRIAVPGCHASAFLLSVRPLVERGIVPPNYPMSAYSITGYSGGGKKMIADYTRQEGNKGENDSRAAVFASPRPYALSLEHKHLPEMQRYALLAAPPIFTPIVANFYQGLAVTTYFHLAPLGPQATLETIHAALVEHYDGESFIRVAPLNTADSSDSGYFDVQLCNGTNYVDLFVFGNRSSVITIARLDNLGKGAAGAAIQCMNLHFGLHEAKGLLYQGAEDKYQGSA